jgi:hypothetical protein
MTRIKKLIESNLSFELPCDSINSSIAQKVKKDVKNMVNRSGLHNIEESMSRAFGENTVKKTFSTYAEKNRLIRESGAMKMALKTGTLGTVGNTVKNHDFHGTKD